MFAASPYSSTGKIPATPSFRTEQADFFFPIRFLRMGRLAQREISPRSITQRNVSPNLESPDSHAYNVGRVARSRSLESCQGPRPRFVRAGFFLALLIRHKFTEGGSPFMLEDALGGLPLRVWVLQGWDILRFASLLLCVSPPLISPRDRCQSILVHPWRRTKNCSTASPSDAPPIAALPDSHAYSGRVARSGSLEKFLGCPVLGL